MQYNYKKFVQGGYRKIARKGANFRTGYYLWIRARYGQQ